MKPEHRILPLRRPKHHHEAMLGVILFLGMFFVFAMLILASKLAPVKLTGAASSQNLSARVNVTAGNPFICNVTLGAGTNLVSFACLPITTPIASFLSSWESNGTNINTIYKYDPLRTGKWRAYNDSLPNWTVQLLSSVGDQDGLYMVMDASERFTHEGYIAGNSSILLRQGWNLVSWPTNETRLLNESLVTINDTYNYVKGLATLEEILPYLTDTPPPMGEALTNMTLYHGYWINMTSADTWTVPR